MSYIVLSRIMDNNVLKGFTITSESGSTNFVPLDNVVKICSASDVVFQNARYDSKYKTLEGTQGSLSSYPSIDKNCNVIDRNGLIVHKTILDKDNGEPIGCVCFNATGVRYNLSYTKMSELLKAGNLACNFEFKVVNGKKVAVPKNGGTFEEVRMENKKKAKIYDSNKGESKPEIFKQEDNSSLPTVGVYDLDAVYASDFNKSADDRLVQAVVNLRKLTPYYSCILQSIKKRPVRGFGTMGVTEDTLFYDIEFVASLSISELTFVLIHEVLHIAMQHSARFGSRTNHALWNIATDLYINSIICNDFGVEFQGKEVEFSKNVTMGGKVTTIKAKLKTPAFGVFLESIGETLDLAKDTPETIYARLLKENKDFKLPQSSDTAGGGESGKSDEKKSEKGNNGGSGQGEQGNPEQDNNQQEESQGSGQDKQKQGEQGNPEQDNNQQEGSQGSGQDKQKQGQGDNSNGSKDDEFKDDENSVDSQQGNGDLDDNTFDGSQVQEVSVVYNGKRITGKIMKDVMSNVEGNSKEDNKKRTDMSKNTLTRMNTKLQIEKEKTGGLDKGFSKSGGSLTQRYIEYGLASGVDWRVILKNVSKKNPKKTFTLAQPNQDYMNMGVTIADRRRIGKPTDISDIKVAIDVSGSVSNATLNWYLSEINNIFNYYNVSGELIYWSTEVGDAGDFKSMKDMLRVQPNSTGGTDAKCIFDYLCGKVKTKTGKMERTKPKDISLLLVITDGYFSMNFDEYASHFGRKTVWLIDGNPVTSKIPFGRILAIGDDPKRN